MINTSGSTTVRLTETTCGSTGYQGAGYDQGPNSKPNYATQTIGGPWVYDPNMYIPQPGAIVGSGIVVDGAAKITYTQPAEPTIRQKAVETLRHLEAAHEHMDTLEQATAGVGATPKTSIPQSDNLDALLGRTSELAALLVGRLATLNAKF